MALNAEFAAFVQDSLASMGPVKIRKMFGGAGVYHGNIMFGLIADDVLYFKVSETSQPAFTREGAQPFSYVMKSGRKAIMSYFTVPERLFDEPDELAQWAKQALADARSAADRPRRRKKT